MVSRGGNVLWCDTSRTDNWRNVSTAEFRKVYQAWPDYRSGRRTRSYLVHELGVENATWIFPSLSRHERLLR